MSNFTTPDFQDTSRLMTHGFAGAQIYIDPPKSFHHWKHLDGTILSWSPRQVEDTLVLAPPLPIPARLDVAKLGVRRQSAALDRALCTRFGATWRDDTIVYVTNWTPQHAPLLRVLRPQHLVFDVVDDVLAFPYAWNRDKVKANWRTIAIAAGVILTVSESLQTQVQRDFGKTAVYAPNGVDADHFSTPPNQFPAALAQWQNMRRVGFAGTMNHWIDYHAIRDLAEQNPQVVFFMMGKQGHFGSDVAARAFAQLTEQPNVVRLGPIAYAALPDYLHSMDVLILPRLNLPSSTASSPLKLYEYLAVGKPVVTAGVPIPDDMTTLVNNATDRVDGLRTALSDALAEASGKRESRLIQRRQYAALHTWSKRTQQALEWLANAPVPK